MRKELKLLDEIPSKMETVDNEVYYTLGHQCIPYKQRPKTKQNKKRIIKKSLRSALKTQLEKTIPSLDEVREEDLLNKYTNLYSEMNEKQRN